MTAHAHAIVQGGVVRDLAKAKRRGKMKSVDWALRSTLARGLETRLKQLFSEWRVRVKRKLLTAYSNAISKADDDLVEQIMRSLDLEPFAVDVVDELTPAMQRTFKNAGISAMQEINFDASPAIVQHIDQRAVDYAGSHGADLVTQIDETTRTDLREHVSTAIETGLSSQDFANVIEGAFQFSEDRALMIARTELAFAHVQGNIAGWRESGIVEKKKWIVSQDNVCDLCEALDGEVVGLDEDFPSDDGDVSGPPLHPNCRCDVVAVLEPQEETEE